MYVAPNGNVFNAGPNTDTGYLSTAGTGSWSATPNLLRTAAGDERGAGTSVMYAPGKIMNIGGGLGGGITNTTELLDINGSAPTFVAGLPMALPRMHVNSTMLPDGSVLVTGGTTKPSVDDQDATLFPELWQPGNKLSPKGTWTVMAPMHEPRLYHSTALLLPDATVLSTGGGQGGQYADHPTYEIFTPPYLCRGLTRPVLSSAPEAVAYQQPFTVTSPQAGTIARATLVRLSSVTHSFNMNQRFLELPVAVVNGSELRLTAPANANTCPPGHYLLFLLDANGTPSIAKIISVNSSACASLLTLAETSVSRTSACELLATYSTGGQNLAAGYRWFIDGEYKPQFDNQSSISYPFEVRTARATIRVEVPPACGGNILLSAALDVRQFFPQCAVQVERPALR
ncbi:galactose oxidase early set domain-containing protein [Hymenobacter algoricola]|uniref:DUF1929 domain-containing protein n=1 Tax=Hymenobacter algoricola TaxID=486267 RepID=A0ABP7M8P8_9BACT